MSATIDELLRAAGRGELERVRWILDQGVGVNEANDIGYTPIMSAARSYRVEIVSLLIELGANVNAITSDGQSVLHAAVGETPSLPERQGACVKMLLEAGADGNITTSTGHTPLMQAAWFGCADSARVLVEAGVDLEKVDSQGQSARDIASKRGQKAIIQLLS